VKAWALPEPSAELVPKVFDAKASVPPVPKVFDAKVAPSLAID
jgi:hypothetical protein